MKLTAKQRGVLRQLLAAENVSFSALVEIVGLDKRTDFVGNNLRGVDFGSADLNGYNFFDADLTNARMDKATGKQGLVLTGAVTTGATGLPAHGLPGGSERRDRSGLPTLVRIPAGSFVMGTPPKENRRERVAKEYAALSTPLRSITIPAAFWLGKYPVTRAQFAAFVTETGYQTADEAYTYEPDEKGEWKGELRKDRDWRNPGFEQTDNDPVVCVNYEDAMAYIGWLNRVTGKPYRLPSEAEWEYAARAGTVTARFWGDGRAEALRYAKVADRTLAARMNRGFDPERFFEGESGYPFTAPVGSFLPNPFGLYDMLGNVWEWTADVFNETLKGIPLDGSPNTTGDSSRRVVRGGSWDDDPRDVRAGDRDWDDTGDRNGSTGFRVARTLFSPES